MTELFLSGGPPPAPRVGIAVDASTLSRSNPPRESSSFLDSVSGRGEGLAFFSSSFRSLSFLFLRSSGDSIPAFFADFISSLTWATFSKPPSPRRVRMVLFADLRTSPCDKMNAPTPPPIPAIRKNMMNPALPRIGTFPWTHSSSSSPSMLTLAPSKTIPVTTT